MKLRIWHKGGVVKEMRPPELLVYTFAWDDRTAVGLSESPFQENTVTVRLEDRGNKTVMHFTQGPFALTAEASAMAITADGTARSTAFAEFMQHEQPLRAAGPGRHPQRTAPEARISRTTLGFI